MTIVSIQFDDYVESAAAAKKGQGSLDISF